MTVRILNNTNYDLLFFCILLIAAAVYFQFSTQKKNNV